MRADLSDGLELLRALLRLIDNYGSAPKVKKADAEIIKGIAYKKLIRLYREENDPLVMMRTGQNALNTIIEAGYNPLEHVLHIMGVNYGGTLTGLFAKQSFTHVIKNGQVLINSGNIVYSLYDVENANNFSELTDYPFSEVLRDTTIEGEIKEKIKKKNWLLIFDDNTHSGETLDDLRKLAESTGYYSQIFVFVCRANIDLSKYKSSLTDEQKLDIIARAGTYSHKTIVNKEKARYKELM